jgi:hypothetical protein
MLSTDSKERKLSSLDVARLYLKRGWAPVAVRYAEKRPTDKGWQKLEVTQENVSEYFDGQRGNIGIKLGRASGGLTDVDLDCNEAVALAKMLLPETQAIFGRRSKPSSHWLYVTNLCETEQRAVLKFVEPRGLARGSEPVTLAELRIGAGDKGAQTIFPGSVHPAKERIRWDCEGEPAAVDGAALKRHVSALAAGALLARNYPNGGARHEAALVLGGFLARVPNMDADDIEALVTAIAGVAHDEEALERGRSAAGAVERLKRGEPTPGLPRMREIWGNEVADTVAKWLDASIQGTGGDHDERITELAKLECLAYEQQRITVAKQLGVRVSALDQLVGLE